MMIKNIKWLAVGVLVLQSATVLSTKKLDQNEEVTLITLSYLSQGMNKPKIWRVLSESSEDLLSKMRDEFFPKFSDKEMALFKKYVEKWAVQAFSKKHSGVLFYSGEFKNFIFNNEVVSAVPNDIVGRFHRVLMEQ